MLLKKMATNIQRFKNKIMLMQNNAGKEIVTSRARDKLAITLRLLINYENICYILTFFFR